MFNRNTSKIGGFALTIFAAAILVVGIGAVGLVAAETVESGSIDVTNETESVYADVTAADDFDGATAPNVTVVIEGLPEDTEAGNGTELLNETRTLAEGSTESFDHELTDSDRDDFDSIEISIESSGDGSLIASTDWGSLERVAGGAGGGLGSVGGIPILLIVALGGGYVLFVRD